MQRWRHMHGLLRAVLTLALLAGSLAACGFEQQPSEPAQSDQSGGGLAPETVAKNFFDDLRTAMNDKQIASEDRRSKWVEQLSNYFAPAERDDMRIALSTALDNFVSGLGKLANSEELTLDIKFDGIEVVSEEDDHALVRPINGSIYLLITRTTDTGAVINLWEQSNPLNTIIGNPDGAVPVVRIGRTWFLTEG